VETSKERLEREGKDPAANPPVDAGETPDQTLEHLFQLGRDDRFAVLEAIAPRILERLDAGDIEPFIESLRSAPMDRAKISAPPPAEQPIESRAKVERDVLEQPLGAQKRILELAAPRIVADLEPAQREPFLKELQARLERMAMGSGAEVESETRH
jgi:hypothetical protein